MSLRLYNTFTRTVQEFTPLEPPVVKMYVCGPTVYDEPHIGHARSAYIFDVLRRYLEYNSFQVRFIRNVTDVDDKIIEKARQETAHSTQHTTLSTLHATCQEVAQRYLERYHATMDRLGIGRPTEEPRATAHVVPEMTDFIAKLLMQGAAYESGGDVYFAVRKFPGYGKLSNRTVDELQAGERIESGERKQDPLDFALWKAAKPGEPSWNSPWGKGRPGWHIECSAMSTKYLGDAFDIHGGGVDLVFPHHENEIAQAQAAGKSFARFWIHNGLLTVNGEKMSKSLGNFITIEKALIGSHSQPDALKMFFLSSHYRSPVDYTSTQIQAAYERWFRLKFLLEDDQSQKWGEFEHDLTPEDREEELKKIEDDFNQAMDDDVNTPKALACLDQLINLTNAWQDEERRNYSRGPGVFRRPAEILGHHCALHSAATTLKKLGNVLGLFSNLKELTLEQRSKIQGRENARRKGDFKTADRIRQELLKENIEIRDTPEGPLWQMR